MSEMQNADPFVNVKRLASAMKVLCMLVSIVSVLLIGLALISPERLQSRLFFTQTLSPEAPTAKPEPGVGRQMLGFVISLVPLLTVQFLTAKAYFLFNDMAKGVVFDRKNARRLKQISYSVFALCLMRPFVRVLLLVVIGGSSIGQAIPGQMSFGLGDLLALFVVGIFLSYALILEESCRLADENQQFV